MKYRYFVAAELADKDGTILTTNAQLELDREVEDILDINEMSAKLCDMFKYLNVRSAVILNYILMKVLP